MGNCACPSADSKRTYVISIYHSQERSIVVRRISIYLLLFLLTAMLCACQSTAVSADGSSVLFGIPVCNADTAETLKAARTPSEILPTLYTQEDGEGIRHAIPLAQNEKTPT